MFGRLITSLLVFLVAFEYSSAMSDVAEIMVKHSRDFMKNGTECKMKVGATDEDVSMFMAKKLPESKTGDCLIACMMEKLELLVDGKFVDDAPRAIAYSVLGHEDMIADLIGDVSKACSKTLTAGEDNCTTAKKLAECGLHHVKKFKDVTKKE